MRCFFLIAFIAFSITCIQGCDSTGMEVGDKLPDLLFYDHNKNKVYIYDYIEPEKILLLHLWGAMCCLTYSVPTSKAVSAIASDKSLDGITVVSVNLDYPIPKVRRISKKLGISHPMLTDKMSNYYNEQPDLKFFFPLAIIYAIDERGIILGKLRGHQLEPAIRELVILARDKRM